MMKRLNDLPEPKYKNVQNYRPTRPGDGWWVVAIIVVLLILSRIAFAI